MTCSECTPEELENEEWRCVSGYEDVYMVSNLGRIQRIGAGHGARVGHIRRTTINSQTGYEQVGLSYRSQHKTQPIHILVTRAFLGPCPKGWEVNHKDGNKRNNRIDNLEYRTHKANQEHAAAMGLMSSGERHRSRIRPETVRRGEACSWAVLTDAIVRGIRSSPETTPAIAARLGIKYEHARRIRKRQAWKHIH